MKFLFQPWNTPGVSYLNFMSKKKSKLQAIVTPWVKDTNLPLRPLVKLFDLSESDIENRACNLWGDTFDPECEYDFTFVDIKFTEVT